VFLLVENYLRDHSRWPSGRLGIFEQLKLPPSALALAFALTLVLIVPHGLLFIAVLPKLVACGEEKTFS